MGFRVGVGGYELFAIGLLCKTNRNRVGKKTDRGTEIKAERQKGDAETCGSKIS